MWCEDVQESSGYDGELDEGLQPAGHMRVEFGLLKAFAKRCSVYYTHSGSERNLKNVMLPPTSLHACCPPT